MRSGNNMCDGRATGRGREELLDQMEQADRGLSGLPTVEEMPHRSLRDKGLYGPTAAHVIEEVHTPLNFAGMTFTTGTTAFQTPVGITWTELSGREAAGAKALELAGVQPGESVLVTYPPLINVFGSECFRYLGLQTIFLERSSQESLILALCRQRPRVVVGESRFLKNALRTAAQLELLGCMAADLVILAAGTPLDLELVELVKKWNMGRVHDLYGCQEFGWLTLDGVPLRSDLVLWERGREIIPVVGGLPVGDQFTLGSHCLNPQGRLATYSKSWEERTFVTTLKRTTARDRLTAVRTAKTILRLKSRIVAIAPDLEVKGERTVLGVGAFGSEEPELWLEGPEQTRFFDEMLQAQMEYQANSKKDPGWCKRDDRIPT